MRSRLRGKSLYPGATARWPVMTPVEIRKKAERLAKAKNCSRSNAVSLLIEKYADREIENGERRDPATGQLVAT